MGTSRRMSLQSSTPASSFSSEDYRVIVVGGEEDLRTGALAEDLLLFVEGVLQRSDVLLQHELVEEGEVG